jgi:hypothetical protein
MVFGNIDWSNLLAGAVAGFFLGVLAHYLYDRSVRWSEVRKLRDQYGHLAGTYVNYHFKDDGSKQPTDGSIRLTFQNADGSFRVGAFHSSGSLEWEGTIKMSREFENTGVGFYRYPEKPDYGTQQVTILPEDNSLHVIGQNISHGKHNEFRHHWKPKRDFI